MKVVTYSEARRHLAELLVNAQTEEVEIHRKDGAVFSLKAKSEKCSSPFDVSGIKTKATTDDILEALRESRRRG